MSFLGDRVGHAAHSFMIKLVPKQETTGQKLYPSFTPSYMCTGTTISSYIPQFHDGAGGLREHLSANIK